MIAIQLVFFSVSGGVGNWLLNKVGGYGSRGLARFLNKRALLNMEEAELQNLHNYVEDRYKMYRGDEAAEARIREAWEERNPGKPWRKSDHIIRDKEYQEWLSFYQNRNKLFWSRRAKLAEELGEVS